MGGIEVQIFLVPISESYSENEVLLTWQKGHSWNVSLYQNYTLCAWAESTGIQPTSLPAASTQTSKVRPTTQDRIKPLLECPLFASSRKNQTCTQL